MPPPRPPLVPTPSIPPSALIIPLQIAGDQREQNRAWAKQILDWGAVQMAPAGADGTLYRMIWGGLVDALKSMWRTGEGDRPWLAEQVERCRKLGPVERQIPGKFTSGGAR